MRTLIVIATLKLSITSLIDHVHDAVQLHYLKSDQGIPLGQ